MPKKKTKVSPAPTAPIGIQAEAAYKINNSPFPYDVKCECSHSVAAHGSAGKICCACSCKQFQPKEAKGNQ